MQEELKKWNVDQAFGKFLYEQKLGFILKWYVFKRELQIIEISLPARAGLMFSRSKRGKALAEWANRRIDALRANTADITKCQEDYENKITKRQQKMDVNKYMPLRIQQFTALLILCGGGTVIALLVFLFELFHAWKRKTLFLHDTSCHLMKY